MRLRRFAAITTAVISIAGGAAFAVAQPASAAGLGTTTFRCAETDTEISVTGHVGDTFTAQSQSPLDCFVTTSSAGVVSWTTDDEKGSAIGPDPDGFYGLIDYSGPPEIGTTVSFVLTTLGSTTWVAQQQGHGLTVRFTVVSGGAPDMPIPMWVQAFARANADASCPDGWTASWDQWPNGGEGGFVCQRSIKSFGD